MTEEPPGPPDDELPEQLRVRRAKLDRLRESGVDPYPVTVERTTTLAAVRAGHPDLEPDTMTGDQAGVTGRVIFFRNTGKLCFATLREGDAELQVMLSRDRVGEESLAAWKADIDLGDHVLVTGEVGTSRRGELSVFADSWQLTAKALRPLPVAHKPMSEELRVRRRYVDLIVRDEARRTVRQRATVMATLRAGMAARGLPRGRDADAADRARGRDRPPVPDAHERVRSRPLPPDRARALPQALHRRRAGPGVRDQSELPQRGCGQFALAGVRDARVLSGLCRLPGDGHAHPRADPGCCAALYGDHVARHHDGTEVDLSGEWPQVPLYEIVSDAVGEKVTPGTPVAELRAIAERHEVGIDPAWGPGKVVEELFEALVQHTLQAPTFVVDYPVDTSPLTRAHRSQPGLAEKWDLYIGGIERATAYSELVDPVIQRERFTAQAALAAAGDPEAMALDEDFLEALEYGMPPTGGMGMGMDRLMMTLTGLGIRETILFPLVRPITSN